MSTSYPRVHVVGSGAYYSYRPMTRFIEKVERNHFRNNSSRPSDFSKYLAAESSVPISAYRRALTPERDPDFRRGLSLPPFDRSNEPEKDTFAEVDDIIARLRRKHPYRLPIENEHVPPHESSEWPENRPHFDLVSSYDTMVDYLGIRDKSKK